MTRRASGTGPADERKMADSRKLADAVPRWSAGEQRHPDEAESVDLDDLAEPDPDDVPGQLPRGWRRDYG